MKKIMCVETREIFCSVNYASECLHIPVTSIHQALRQKCKAKGLHFVWCPTPQKGEQFANELLESKNSVKTEYSPDVKELIQTISKHRNKIYENQRLIKKCQREIEELKEFIFVDLFKSWYNREATMDECAEISGYSKQYLYRRFRQEQIERGLDSSDR